MKVTVKRITHRTPAIRAAMVPQARAVVRKTLFDIEADWKANVAVDTGAYRNSIQTVMDGDLSGAVVSGVEHAIYNELGTYKMPARPAAQPAAERARGPFVAAMAKVVS